MYSDKHAVTFKTNTAISSNLSLGKQWTVEAGLWVRGVGWGGGSRSYRAALTPPAHPKQYRGCHLTLRPSFVTILHDSFGGGSRGQTTTMACPYNVSSRDEQRRRFVTNCSNCDSVDGLVLQGKILYVGL